MIHFVILKIALYDLFIKIALYDPSLKIILYDNLKIVFFIFVSLIVFS